MTTTIDKAVTLALSIIVKARREQLELTQQDLATQVGISRQQISNIERGIYNPSAITLYKLNVILECNILELIELALICASKEEFYNDL